MLPTTPTPPFKYLSKESQTSLLSSVYEMAKGINLRLVKIRLCLSAVIINTRQASRLLPSLIGVHGRYLHAKHGHSVTASDASSRAICGFDSSLFTYDMYGALWLG